MKKLFLCLTAAAALLTGCDKDDDWGLPALPDPADVCSAMDDPAFRAFCIREFDADGNGKVSPAEARAVEEIGFDKWLSSLKGIEYFVNLKIIGSVGCSATEIDLSKNLKLEVIANRAFIHCPELKRIVFPKTLKFIGKDAFLFNSEVTEIIHHMPGMLSYIGIGAFSQCHNLTSTPALGNVTTIERSTFKSCTNLTEIKFSGKQTAILNEAFWDCISLTKVIFPENMQSIGIAAFAGCKNLAEIELPSTLTDIKMLAFDCYSLSKVTCRAIVPPNLESYAFRIPVRTKNNPLPTLYVPKESIDAYKNSGWADYFPQILPI